MTSAEPADDSGSESLDIRPPLQQRSRLAWLRVLDAGVALLKEGGYEAFTIAAVCDRAQVAPRALYARANSKDALFLAVYEHGMAHVRADHVLLTDDQRWDGLAAGQVVAQAVRDVAEVFSRHPGLLRSVVLISGVNPEVSRRGARYSQELGDAFTGRLLRIGEEIGQPDPETAIRAAFTVVFSALVLRVAYGPSFTTPAPDEAAFLDALVTMVHRYLLGS